MTVSNSNTQEKVQAYADCRLTCLYYTKRQAGKYSMNTL